MTADAGVPPDPPLPDQPPSDPPSSGGSRPANAVRARPAAERAASSAPPRPPISDCPWFWLYLFSCMALCGLLLIWPKYARRQGTLEARQEGREEAWRQRRSDPVSSAGVPGAPEDLHPDRDAQGMPLLDEPPGQLDRLRLEPLAAALGLVFLGSLIQMVRWRKGQANAAG